MKFSNTLALLSAVAFTQASTLPEKRQTGAFNCEPAASIIKKYDGPWVLPLVNHCGNVLGSGTVHENYINPWKSWICVGAAVAATPGIVRDTLYCRDKTEPAVQDLPNMPFSVYQNITHSQSDKVFISKQNLIDLVYRSIETEDEGSPILWPASANEVIATIDKIFDWTATGDTIPYSHFSDWLKYSPQPSL
ncbi:hypothetical protein K488DRAFT_67685 [Vararia minispora EC-137]|uniref:Uncharacterized protein n=1 Tax=Vararia minispora EC-137 TaxID=1314806 RepID=A0ACB8QXE1_9AGAM|nr:hypothetical protein K488DRAFT_67685 [Vararia minispora EC-137]